MNPFTSMNLGFPPKPKKKKGKGNPQSHLTQALSAHKAGDLAMAKRHALNAASAIHAQSTPEAASPDAASFFPPRP